MNKARSGKGATGVAERRWRQWKEPEARAVLADWARSGLSAAAFAKSRGLSVQRVWYWSKRLGARPSEQAATVSFVPVSLSTPPSAGMLEIERFGVVIRMREDLDARRVAQLVAALAEAVC